MDETLIKDVWPQWKIGRRLGRGSFGNVYKATREEYGIQSSAAIKIISIPQNELELDSLLGEGMDIEEVRTYLQTMVDDFIQEIQILATLKGLPHIVTIEDYAVVKKDEAVGWDICIRMELLTPLPKYTADKEYSEKEVIRLGIEMCTALQLCEQRKIIHRDIKPENIFVNNFQQYKLGDFGIARQLEQSTMHLSQKGTVSYMAPEVEKGLACDATVDLYSLGLVLYRLANQHRMPFLDAEKQLLTPMDRVQANRRRLEGEQLPPPCDASEQLSAVILCACNSNPKRRFSSATAMKRALESLLDSDAQKPQPQSPLPPKEEPKPTPLPQETQVDETENVPNTAKRKNYRVRIVGFLIVLLCIVAVGGFFFVRGYIPEPIVEETTAESNLAEEYLLQADSYSEQGDELSAREVLLTAQKKISSDNDKYPQILQSLIQVDINLAEEATDDAEATMYRQEAIGYLEKIIANGWGTFTTYSSMIVLYQKEGDLEAAEQILLEIQETYAEDYRWYKRAAFLEISKQESLEAAERDYTDFLQYYEQALTLYGESDEDNEMAVLGVQYSEVEAAGYFENDGGDNE